MTTDDARARWPFDWTPPAAAAVPLRTPPGPVAPRLSDEQLEAFAAAGRAVAAAFESLGRALADAYPEVARAVEADRRLVALHARRNRNTGPPPPRLDGRRSW